MGKREQAIKLLNNFRENRPQIFLETFESSEKGINFILGYLEEAKHEVIAKDLAQALNVSTARIATLLNKMEKKDLIQKHNSTKDARKTVIILTKKGQHLTTQYKEVLIDITIKMIEEVGMEDLEKFIEISKKMKQSIVKFGKQIKKMKKDSDS